MKLFVSNIRFDATEDDLHDVFGDDCTINIVHDRDTGKSRGFAFVDFGKNFDATQWIEELNESKFMGRTLYVKEAEERRPPQEREKKGNGGKRHQKRYEGEGESKYA